MTRHRASTTAGLLALLVLLCPGDGLRASPADAPGASASPSEAQAPVASDEAESDEDDEGLRQRLTEREDKRRPLEPWSVEVGGRPLTIGGEYELDLGYLKRRVVGEPAKQRNRFLLEHGLDVEVFYSFGEPLSIFVQGAVLMEEDLLSGGPDDISDVYLERGEMWIYSEDIAGSNVNFDIGRLDFEDERRWWWDDELDALRIAYETDSFELELALARELWPNRSDEDEVDPEQERLLRLFAEASWDWSENHGLELFVLHQRDHSPTERPGDVIEIDREDESDADLTWLGARAMGVVDLRSRGILGYWLDAAWVTGDERFLELEEITRARLEVEDLVRRDVSGWAFDVGASWILPLRYEPRIFAGYAVGSGDRSPDSGSDRSFRQTGIHANEAGFGGVERFAHYGVALDPELSNLRVLTLGAGLSVFRASSLDLVYHHYRLVEPATSLRDARLELGLTGEHRDLGHGLDLVLAVEEWERLELEFVASGFRGARALGDEEGTWSVGGAFAIRYAF